MINLLLWLLLVVAGLELLCRAGIVGQKSLIDHYGRKKSYAANPGNNSIVAAGDSLTFGYRVREQYAWPHLLTERLSPRGGSVFNAGISGHTSSQLLDRLDRDVFRFKPKTVIIWIGTNDAILRTSADPENAVRPFDRASWLQRSALFVSLHALPPLMKLKAWLSRSKTDPETWVPRVDIGMFTKNLGEMLDRCRTSGIQNLVIVGLPRIPDHYAKDATVLQAQRSLNQRYTDVLVDLCRREDDVVFVPMDDLEATHFLSDGLHFSVAGNLFIANKIYKVLTDHDYV